jgi:hypothetical protein
MEWIVGITTGLISGLVAGAVVSSVFYWLSGWDLKREADDLRRLNILTIKALVEAGIAEVNFDATGKPAGLVYRLQAGAGELKLSGSLVSLDVQRHPQLSAE